jgi:hypothetical protein
MPICCCYSEDKANAPEPRFQEMVSEADDKEAYVSMGKNNATKELETTPSLLFDVSKGQKCHHYFYLIHNINPFRKFNVLNVKYRL